MSAATMHRRHGCSKERFAVLAMGRNVMTRILGALLATAWSVLVVVGMAVVYDWAERPAELPAPLTRFLMQKDASPDGPTSPGSPG